MQKFLLAWDERTGFSWQAFLMAAACAVALLAVPLRGQDDNGASAPPPNDGGPDSSASFQTFYDSLGNQGNWIQSSDYGYVWQPQVNDPDWAPYTAGHWVYTDDGWAWVSDESWGWATYHYGRWVNLDGTGWCWVPGYTWAPAWVSWRYGGGYCGWAPLPPDSFVGVDYFGGGFAFGIGFHIGGDCDGFYGIGAGCYNFVPVNCLGYRNYHGYYRNRGDNFGIINQTTNVTNLNVTRTTTTNTGGTASSAASFHHVTTGGPPIAQVNAVSQTPVQTVKLVRTSQPGGGGTVTANSLALYAPHVSPAATTEQPARVTGAIGHVTINRGVDVMHPLAVNSRLAASPATEAQVQQARIAQGHAPASAKVVTDVASVRPVLQAPLTSLKPITRQTMPSSTLNTSPNTMTQTERAPSASGVAPAVKTYPQTGEASHVNSPGPVYPSASSTYQPHSPTSGSGGGSESHSYVPPPVHSSSAPPSTQYHPSTGGGGGSPSGGSSHSSSGGGGGGSSHSGGGGSSGGSSHSGGGSGNQQSHR